MQHNKTSYSHPATQNLNFSLPTPFLADTMNTAIHIQYYTHLQILHSSPQGGVTPLFSKAKSGLEANDFMPH